MKTIRFIAAAACLLLFAGNARAAKLYIREYSGFGPSAALQGDQPPIAKEPGVDQTPVDFTSGATSSAAVAAGTRLIRVMCDVQCSISPASANPTAATTSNAPLAAFTAEYFGVDAGGKVSVIAHP